MTRGKNFTNEGTPPRKIIETSLKAEGKFFSFNFQVIINGKAIRREEETVVLELMPKITLNWILSPIAFGWEAADNIKLRP